MSLPPAFGRRRDPRRGCHSSLPLGETHAKAAVRARGVGWGDEIYLDVSLLGRRSLLSRGEGCVFRRSAKNWTVNQIGHESAWRDEPTRITIEALCNCQ